MKRKQISFRVTEDQNRMVDELARLSNCSRNELLVGLIVGQYDKINGNPEVKKLMEQMKVFADQLKLASEGR